VLALLIRAVYRRGLCPLAFCALTCACTVIDKPSSGPVVGDDCDAIVAHAIPAWHEDACIFNVTGRGTDLTCPVIATQSVPSNCSETRVRILPAARSRYHDPLFFEELFLRSDSGYSQCRELLKGSLFAQAMKRVAAREADVVKSWPFAPRPLDDVQLGMASIFQHIRRWRMCPSALETDDGSSYIHGLFDPVGWEVSIFKTSCDAISVYDSELDGFITVYRFLLVLGHETGHAIDALDGDLNDREHCQSRENRATVYGTYLAQCWTRFAIETVRSRMKIYPVPGDPVVGRCQEAILSNTDYGLARIRNQLLRNDGTVVADQSTGPTRVIGEIVGCRGL
jgi:hypothetical protein